jgi:hypothetical protein
MSDRVTPDPEERAMNRRAIQIVIVCAALTVGSAVAGVIGNHEANSAANRQASKLTSALRGVTFGDAGLAPFNGELTRIERLAGSSLNWDGASGPEFTEQVTGWWFWAPRCVVGTVTQSGATVRVYHTSSCPPVHR